MGLFTCRDDLGKDIVNLFHYPHGHAPKQPYEKVLVAPRDMRKKFEVDRAGNQDQHKAHGNGRILPR
ncbi:MAG: hypothetical protein R3E31_10015 [Chloroflexota bacterium]